MNEPRLVECERAYAAPPALVYRAMTEPHLMRRWWSPDPEVAVDVLEWTLRVHGSWRFAVRFPDGTRLRVRHEGFPTDESRTRHEEGWSATLARLPEVLA